MSQMIGRVVSCLFDQYQYGAYKGEYYMRIDVQPVSEDQYKVHALVFPLCSTSNGTEDDSMREVFLQLSRMNCKTSQLKNANDLEEIAKTVSVLKPIVAYNTNSILRVVVL